VEGVVRLRLGDGIISIVREMSLLSDSGKTRRASGHRTSVREEVGNASAEDAKALSRKEALRQLGFEGGRA